jgi:7-cyano-7-deazaguanine synthase in queuosine biosynthesis
MSSHRLLLRAGPRQLERLSTADFLWSPRGEPSSMETNLSPRLEELGAVPPLHVDLVRLAVLAFLADRSSPRNKGTGVRWNRDLDLTVPVSDPVAWTSVAEEFEHHLHVLTGDRWRLSFEQERPRKQRALADVQPAKTVCLFSGGADSLAGALTAQALDGEPPVLVSHWDFGAVSGVQTTLVDELEKRWGSRPEHHRIEVKRWARQAGSGTKFPKDKSRRSRSFLFLALGLAVSVVRDAELWMSENGFTTINPPLSPERRGSLTTRTTHPGFLDGLADTGARMGLTVKLRNPLEDKTKGQVLQDVAATMTSDEASRLFSMSHSCGKPSWFKGFYQGDHCGLCFGCLVRRGSFLAAGLTDKTDYIEEALRGDTRRDEFVTPGRRRTLAAVRYRLNRGFSPGDILAMGLPDRVDVADALSLVKEGLDELRPIADSIP